MRSGYGMRPFMASGVPTALRRSDCMGTERVGLVTSGLPGGLTLKATDLTNPTRERGGAKATFTVVSRADASGW